MTRTRSSVPATTTRPSATTDDARQIWRSLAATPSALRLEDAFTQELGNRGFRRVYTLDNLLAALIASGGYDEIADLAHDVLASGAEDPSVWLPLLVEARVRTGRLEEAELAMRDLVARLDHRVPEMLSAAMLYHHARGEGGDESLLCHAGVKWFPTFPSVLTGSTSRFGKKPDDLEIRFARWLDRWVGVSHWDPSTSSRLDEWIVWFRKIGPSLASRALAFEAERNRRLALYERLKKASDESTARPLAEQVMRFPGSTEDLAKVAHALYPRAPVAAYDLLHHAITSERREAIAWGTGK